MTAKNSDLEITVKAIILSILLAFLLTASTIYLGLKVGITISASIPAAVVSLGILSLFKRSSILESNLVQTSASGGMSLASGIIFCLPALLILDVWDRFHYFETALITLYGGLLGVFFAIPFRKILLNDKNLHFPEGVAIGYVLQAKEGGARIHEMLWGGLLGAVMTLGQMGLKVISEGIDLWFRLSQTIVGFGLGFSPVMLGAGFIIGARVALVIFIGILLAWIVGVPILAYQAGVTTAPSIEQVMFLWSNKIRYIGVGVLLVGSIVTFLKMIKPLIKAVKVVRQTKKSNTKKSKLEQDIPKQFIIAGIFLVIVPITLAYGGIIDIHALKISEQYSIGLLFMLGIYTLVAGFIFSVVCGYIVGLVGSSASPLSALALGGILIIALALLAILGGHVAFVHDPEKARAASTLVIMVGVVIICAASITNDTIQDLKVGQMIGSVPWKQQIMQILGVVVAAFVTPPILQLLFEAYGIAGIYPRTGMDPNLNLVAPQSQLMAAVAKGVFTQNVPWFYIGIGGLIAIIHLAIEYILENKGYGSFPVLALGLGIYVPLGATTPLVFGGLVAYLAERRLRASNRKVDPNMQRGFIFSSGLIAGGAIMGILLAIPFVLTESTDVLSIVGENFSWLSDIFGGFVAVLVCVSLYRTTVKSKHSKQ